MRNPFHSAGDRYWRFIESVPQDQEVDVVYINDTLDPPSCGVLRFATLHRGFYVSSCGKEVPAVHVKFWTEADQIRSSVHPMFGGVDKSNSF